MNRHAQRFGFAIVACVFGAAAASAWAQCEPTWHAGGLTYGVNNPVSALTTWDPDGPGPSPVELVIAGQFDHVGDLPAAGAAAWDGVTWRAIGNGLTGLPWSIVDYQGELFVFSMGSSNSIPIHRLHNGAWENFVPPILESPNALGVFQGRLLVGTVAEDPANPGHPLGHVLAWDGTQWSQLGAPIRMTPFVFHDFAGSLIMGGSLDDPGFTSPISTLLWDGTAWRSMGIGGNGRPMEVRELAEHDGRLFAGTYQYGFGGSTGAVQAWDGNSWVSAGPWLTTPHVGLGVSSLISNEGSLLATGYFNVGTGGVDTLARWTGTLWEPWPSSTNSVRATETYKVASFHGELIAAGLFHAAGGHAINNLARWNGTRWLPLVGGTHLAQRWSMHAVGAVGDQVVVAGQIQVEVDGQTTHGIVAREGEAWHALGEGLSPPNDAFEATVMAVGTFQSKLVAAGQLKYGHPAQYHNTAMWDGTTWNSLAADTSSFVRALLEFRGELIAGGSYIVTVNNESRTIGRYDGQAWHPLSTGPDGEVLSLTEFQNELIAGGSFTHADSIPTQSVAAWNGASWRQLGAGVPFVVRALTVYRGQLVAAGSSGTSGRISIWDGTAWTNLLSTPTGESAIFYSLAANGDNLFVAGSFQGIGQVASPNIALWDGVAWHAMDGGVNNSTIGMVVRNGQLFVAGTFNRAGDVLTPILARWGPLCTACYANCDSSTVAPMLNGLDFMCFLNQFAAGTSYANCDGSTVPPVLNVNDFQCFLNRFAAGCP